MQNHWGIKVFSLLLLGFFVACDSTEPMDGPGEEELITKVTLALTATGQTDVMASATDDDGDGNNFQIDDIVLAANTVYTGSISFEDTINNEDITAEVEEEADEHQVHLLPDGNLDVAVAATDEDANGLPLGLTFTITTQAASEGQLRVVLSHYDDSPKDGTTLSDESDVDIMFMVTVE